MQPLQDLQICDGPRKGLRDVRSFIGAYNFYRRHIHNFTYSSVPLTDLIKKDQSLGTHRQGRGLLPGVEEENFLYQLPWGTLR